MSILKKLASDSALYGVSSILGRSLNFLLVFLHTRVFIAPESMSVLIDLFSIVTFLNVLYTYGMETSFFRFAKKGTADFDKVYNISQSALLISSLVFSAFLILFSNQFINYLNYPGQGYLIVWFAIVIALDTIVAIPFARLRLENKAKRYVMARIASILINIFLNFFFLWFCKGIFEERFLVSFKPIIDLIYFPILGVGYIVLAMLIGNLVYIPLLWDLLINKFKFEIDKNQFKKLWVYGYPILVMGLAGMVNQQIDRRMLVSLLPNGFYEGLSNKDVLGIYGNCYKLSVLISLATQSFRYAADPFFFSKADDKNAPAVFAKVMYWFVIVCCVLWVAICLNLDVIGLYIGKTYRLGLVIVPLLLLGNLLLGVYFNLAVWFKLTDKTHYGTWITLFGAFINIALNFILIPKIGFMGCAWAFAISCALMCIVCYILGDKFFPVPYNLKVILGYLFGSGLLIWLNAKVPISNYWIAIPFHGLILLLFLAIIIVFERETILPEKWKMKLGF